MTHRPTSLFVLREDAFHAAYGDREQQRIAAITQVAAPPQTAEGLAARPELFADVEVLISGWGGLRLDRELLAHAPRLRAVFYAGGSVAPIMTPDAWARGLVVTSAYAANAVAVAEYTVSMALLSLKQVWRLAARMRELRAAPQEEGVVGVYHRCIGLLSLGAIGRAVIERLKGVDVSLLAYDPFVTPEQARALGVTLVSLPELFARADVVSVHTPHLPETEHLVRAEHLRAMKRGATFINTSLGMVVDEEALIDVASQRPDLQVILDMTETLPPDAGSPLYTLPNVLLTPHIAGSRGTECRRMGAAMVEELERYVVGEPLRWRISHESARNSSHASPSLAMGSPSKR